MRLAWPAVAAGVAVTVLGAAGLVRAAVPQASAAGSSGVQTSGAPIVVTGAYITAPLPPTHVSAAYFTVHNTTGTPDRLASVSTGAGPTAVLHVESTDGSMAAMTNGVTIPAHGTLVLKAGQSHVMIEGVYPTVKVGQSVDIDLEFDNAGSVDVLAPVVKFGSTAASGAHS